MKRCSWRSPPASKTKPTSHSATPTHASGPSVASVRRRGADSGSATIHASKRLQQEDRAELSEHEVVAVALAHPPVARVLAAAAQLADARCGRRAAAPHAVDEREHQSGAAASSPPAATLTQPATTKASPQAMSTIDTSRSGSAEQERDEQQRADRKRGAAADRPPGRPSPTLGRFNGRMDPHAVLGVSADADDDAIAAAYRKLAKRFHPDARPGDEAAALRMAEINVAYAILRDSQLEMHARTRRP